MDKIRIRYGTNIDGTSFLGLYETALYYGFETKGYETDVEKLKTLSDPCILHTIKDDKWLHFIVSFGFRDGKFIISDPAKGIIKLDEKSLAAIWKSNRLLIVKKGGGELPTVKEATSGKSMVKIKNILFDNINLLIGSLLFGIAVSLFGLVTVVYSKVFVDDIIPGGDTNALITGLLIISGVLLAKSFLNYGRGLLVIRFARKFNNRIINFFYKNLMYLPLVFFDTRRTGELVSRMNDTIRIQTTILYIFNIVVINLVLIIIYIIATFYFSKILGFIALSALFIFAVISFGYTKKLKKGHRNTMEAYAGNESNYIDSIQGIETIKANNKESDFTKRTSVIHGIFQNKIYDLSHLQVKYNLLFEIIGIITIASFFTAGALESSSGIMSIGEFVAVIQLGFFLTPTIISLTSSSYQLQEANVALEHMLEFADFDHEPNFGKKKADKVDNFEITDLNFSYPGRLSLIKNFSMKVKKGEIVGIAGENGSGKTTLLKLIQKFYVPKSGQIQVNEIDLSEIENYSWRSIIGIVPQEIKIFNGSVIANITLDDYPNEDKVNQFLTSLGLMEIINAFPDGLRTIVGEIGVNLSGGQKQILGFCRALYKNPKLLLLDEATSNLDPNTETIIRNVIESIKKDLAIIWITHREKPITKFDAIYTISN